MRLRVVLNAAVLVLACGGDDSQPPPPGQGSGPLTTGIGTGGDDGGDGDGGGQGGEFSYIWIASSPNGYVVKIDTEAAEEVARYRTGFWESSGVPDPSRTSVNLHGDVAVVNRAGSLVKIAARTTDCVDRNDDDTITTSSQAGNLLAWGHDECVLWHRDVTSLGAAGPRAVSWEPEVADEETGEVPNQARLWVGWLALGTNTGVVHRLDGATGESLDEVTVEFTSGAASFGPYGGAANKDGDFWLIRLGGPLVRIDGETLAVESHGRPEPSSFYGLGLDADGNPWMAGLDGTVWAFKDGDFLAVTGATGPLRGIQIDRDGYAWAAQNNPCALVKVDTLTDAFVESSPIPGCSVPVGISIDVHGYVWVVDQGASMAFKVAPDDFEVVAEVAVELPYSYSDMTGAGLQLVAVPPA